MRTYAIREILEMAINTEKLGYQFYSGMMEKFKDDEGLSKLFQTLAHMEQNHEHIFSTLLGKIADTDPGEGWDEAQSYFRAMVESEFFLGSGKALPNLDHVKTVRDAAEFALSFEKETTLFFTGLRGAVQDKDTVDKIIKEELSHIAWIGQFIETLDKQLSGTLYIVATPIGNLEDITARALRVLREADMVAAEDTRHTLKLLNYFEIKKPMISYWGEKEKAKAEEVLARLKEGKDVALVSDAGTPGISDPGEVVVRLALEMGIEVEAVPGPSAFVSALSVSGLSTKEFTFIGFLPSKNGPRQRRLKELSLEPRTLIFYESPHRIVDMLIDTEEVLGNRKAAVFKEMTKKFETVYRGGISDILDLLENEMIAGEYVVLLEGKEAGEMSIDEAVQEVHALMKKGLGRKQATKTVAEQYGMKKKELYDQSLKEDKDAEEE